MALGLRVWAPETAFPGLLVVSGLLFAAVLPPCRFTLVPDQTMEVVQREVDALLMALVDANTGLAEKRDAMLTGLGKRATQGGTEINAHQFLQDYALDFTPLTAWAPLRDRAAAYLDGTLYRSGSDPTVDVRRAGAAELAGRWQPTTPIPTVSGESGGGKSLLLYALAGHLVSSHRLMMSEMPVAPEGRLPPGTPVEIVSGPLASLRGKVIGQANHMRFIVEVHFQKGARVDIEGWMLQKLT